VPQRRVLFTPGHGRAHRPFWRADRFALNFSPRGGAVAGVTISDQDSPIHDRLLAVRERIARAAARAGRDPASITLVAVSKTQPAEHPDTVKALLRGHVKSVEWLNSAAADEKAKVINAALEEAAGAELKADVIDRSLKNIVFTVDPLAGTYPKLLKDGVEAGTTRQADINGIFDLRALNEVTGQKTSAAGLGKE
jgi:alkanesulfonate monooxygenase SsuD/methylene tetrahydromethanopterin reductase-like flavin-dependent oxidoreductase (luciferase family)